ncbi:MAG TPA: Xaa-Pro peptidase family protein [Acidimicrobiales bacterium]|nr:Xaa-Pro peptidase family protein [Acidimicrobiales bacterium]
MALPPMDVSARLDRLRVGFDSAGCEALLVTNLTNVRYLTGFTGSAGSLLVRSDGATLFTDGRYATQSSEQLSAAGVDAEIQIGNVPEQRTALTKSAAHLSTLGLESGHATWAAQREYSAALPQVQLVATEGLVEALRRVKDVGELARIEAACAIADEALAGILPLLRDRPSERQFGIELDFAMRRAGATDVSFESIVASGPNGAKPHARPSDRRIREGDLVVLDFGALVEGYHSDMTRTLSLGEPASARLAEVVEVVRGSQAAGVSAVGPGVAARDIDEVCRAFIRDAGFGEAFVHGTGHGVGLDIHEFPILGQTATASLEAGFVVTVEPGVYLPDEGGVRIEDTVVVTAEGCRRLTNAPKELVIS